MKFLGPPTISFGREEIPWTCYWMLGVLLIDNTRTMGDLEADECPITILDVLDVDLCARAILEHVPVEELVRSERVSRRWQRAVLHYLRTCRTLSYEGFCYPYNPIDLPELTTDDRTIVIDEYIHSFPLVCKTLDKWGPYIMKVITDIGKGRYLDIIASKCPNLEQIEIVRSDCDKRSLPSLTPIKKMKQLKQIVLHLFSRYDDKNSDLVLGELFQDINCENIALCYNDNLTGTCLKSLKSDVLKSLTLNWCYSLSVSNLLSALDNMRTITSLELGGSQNSSLLTDAYLLLIQMPQLEELTLECFYNDTAFGQEWIHAFSQLGNLKRLTMCVSRGSVTDYFLEGLARGCRNLEYLKIPGSGDSITVRGVTALCCRSPSARTTLHFGMAFTCNVNIVTSRFPGFEVMPLYRELAALGCVELSREWFTAACRDPRGRELHLNPSAGDHNKSLKLFIFDGK